MLSSWKHLNHVLGTVVVLVNTDPYVAGAEGLPDAPALQKFVKDRIITEVAPVVDADVAAVREVRARLVAVFTAPDSAARQHLVNETLAAATITPRLVDHDGLGIHLHYFRPYAPLAQHLATDCAMALGLLIASGGGERLQVCAARDCNRAFVDFSRNQSRVYCDSRTCGNRINAAAFRARQRALKG